jgi:hypothetical protein
MGGAFDPEFEDEAQGRAGGSSAVRARILWPALGFPAVVTPNDRPAGARVGGGDATTSVCVLVASDKRQLTSQDAAKYLRYVPWANRGRRHVAANAFAASEIIVRSDVAASPVTLPNRKDVFGEHVRFGANARGENGIAACLADRVRAFYRNAGLAYLHEIRVSEAATTRLTEEQYHLFWNNEGTSESAPSDDEPVRGSLRPPGRRSEARGRLARFPIDG